MSIRDAQIPADEQAESRILQLLTEQFSADEATLEQLLPEVARRVYTDLNRLPWVTAVQRFVARVEPDLPGKMIVVLESVLRQMGPEAYGAAMLLMALAAERSAQIDPVLMRVAQTHPDRTIRHDVGAYLAGQSRTRAWALQALSSVPGLEALMERQSRLEAVLGHWQVLVAMQQRKAMFELIAREADLAFELENAFLDQFEAGGADHRAELAAILQDGLAHDHPAVQAFVCDVLTSPGVLAEVAAKEGHRLRKQLERLAGEAPEPVRHYAAQLITHLETGAALAQELQELPLPDQVGLELVHRKFLPEQPAEYLSIADLPLHQTSRSYLTRQFGEAIYRHQKAGVEAFLAGEDLCLATGTASGKSMVFFTAGVELLARNQAARIIAIYPLKALAREQEERWRMALAAAGLPDKVGRIEGGVPSAEREAILKRCRVVLFTPDVIHAWLLSSLAAPAVRSFIKYVRLVVVDEVHVYSGVFGSNAAYLFRRLQHAATAVAGMDKLRFIAASATVADPVVHLEQLFARRFRVIGSDQDSSPRHRLDIWLLRAQRGRDLNSAVPGLLQLLATDPESRFIAFVDSRKQAEQLATIAQRNGPDDGEVAVTADRLSGNGPTILPYRSGYEEEDRAEIQQRLTSGELRGIISTSALELGLDIPGVSTVVLVGVPGNATSLRQRMGRAGRHAPGRVIFIDGGSATDAIVFRDPAKLFDRPPAPSSLYLENRRIQYIHALCFAGAGGEYDLLRGDKQPDGEDAIDSPVAWPDGFLALCQSERIGGVPGELLSMKAEAGDDPWHSFPLRDVGSQFQVETHGQGLGRLSHAQLMREAYPGAIYYYMAKPYRITRVSTRERKVHARQEKHYTSEPSSPPPQIFPSLQGEGLHEGYRFGELSVAECDLYVSEMVFGFTERRGTQKHTIKYPCQYWQRDRFSRNYTTTGALLSHPALQEADVQLEALAQVVLEAFLLVAPFDRSEVSCSTGRHRRETPHFGAGERFIALYDQTYGSLRLTGRLLDPSFLREVFREAVELARGGLLEEMEPLSPQTLDVLRRLKEAARQEAALLDPAEASLPGSSEERELVIMPGSAGWIITDLDQEFQVERVFAHPREGLRYYGYRVGTRTNPAVKTYFPLANIRPIPGVSKLGLYDYETGELVALDEDGV